MYISLDLRHGVLDTRVEMFCCTWSAESVITKVVLCPDFDIGVAYEFTNQCMHACNCETGFEMK